MTSWCSRMDPMVIVRIDLLTHFRREEGSGSSKAERVFSRVEAKESLLIVTTLIDRKAGRGAAYDYVDPDS